MPISNFGTWILLFSEYRLEEAEQSFSTAIHSCPIKINHSRWVMFGSLCRSKKSFDFAERAFRNAIEANPEDK